MSAPGKFLNVRRRKEQESKNILLVKEHIVVLEQQKEVCKKFDIYALDTIQTLVEEINSNDIAEKLQTLEEYYPKFFEEKTHLKRYKTKIQLKKEDFRKCAQ